MLSARACALPARAEVTGISRPVGGNWSVFVDYKGTRSWNEADLDGGGSLQAEITTRAIDIGLSPHF